MINRNIELMAGDVWNVEIQLMDNSNQPEDITGDKVIMTIKASATVTTPIIIQKIVTNHTNPTQGLTFMRLDSSDTALLPAVAVYDIVWRQYPSTVNNVTTLTTGKIFTNSSITSTQDKVA